MLPPASATETWRRLTPAIRARRACETPRASFSALSAAPRSGCCAFITELQYNAFASCATLCIRSDAAAADPPIPRNPAALLPGTARLLDRRGRGAGRLLAGVGAAAGRGR